MHKNLRIFNFFKNSLEDAFFGVEDILSNEEHEQHNNLLLDIKDLNKNLIERYIQVNNFERHISRDRDIYLQKCVIYLIEIIQKGIAIERLNELQKKKSSLPYKLENLKSLIINENNLTSIKNFDLTIGGYRYNDFVYQLTPMINGSNSSYWISQTISSLAKSKKLDFQIRLDPFIEVHYKEYFPIGYKMTIYGKPLDWERLRTLREDEHGRWMNDDLSNNNITDFVWRPNEKEVHFTCEELPKSNEIEYRGSRYFHAIFDKKTGEVIHCDGAIRMYNQDEIEYRMKYHVRNPEVIKIGKRIKVFQLDDIIDQETFVLLITNYMVWNHDVLRYFN